MTVHKGGRDQVKTDLQDWSGLDTDKKTPSLVKLGNLSHLLKLH